MFLCYEGFEKLAHKLTHAASEDEARHGRMIDALADPAVDLVAFEAGKIRGAVRTDFILSAEIIVISLGTVAGASFGQQVAVLAGIAVIMTVGVYGLVAGIVKLDDGGLHLSTRGGEGAPARVQRALGRAILAAAPGLMKALSIVGTAAMFLVGGGILAHGIPGAEALVHGLAGAAGSWAVGPAADAVVAPVMNAVLGLVAGAVALGLVTLLARMRAR